jgi:serine/threonine-protein kinase
MATMLGPLEILGSLGGGTYGEVVEARNARTHERFAVKRLRPGLTSAIDLERFIREARIMRQLRHPNLMPVLHIGESATPPFFLMPFREGVTLEKRLETGALPPQLVVRIALDASLGLAEAARCGIIHRDLKPSNMFLEKSGRTVIFDFGLAKPLGVVGVESLTKAGMIVGTPAYMAPEQIQGEPVSDRTDVYALGVTLTELLLGKNPFDADDVLETLQRHLTALPRRLDALLPHRVRPELGEIIDRMIAKVPANRPRMETCHEAFANLARFYDRAPKELTRRLGPNKEGHARPQGGVSAPPREGPPGLVLIPEAPAPRPPAVSAPPRERERRSLTG